MLDLTTMPDEELHALREAVAAEQDRRRGIMTNIA